MPSGAKKRKQAKKRKEQQAHSNSNNSSFISDTHSQGNDDLRSQDERDSDGGELESPASLDHQNQRNPFNKESEKSLQSSLASEESSVGLVENESVIEIQRGLNLRKNVESVDVKVEHIESSKASHNRDDKSSSSSSSDDESQAVEKAEEVKGDFTNGKPISKANGNSVVESEVPKHITESARVENVEVIEWELKEDENELLPKSDVVPGLVPEFNESNQNAEESTVVSASNVSNGKEDKLLKSSSSQTGYGDNIKDSEGSAVAHSSEAGKDINKAKDFEASGNIGTQPDVPPAPRLAQRTSILSCCGLFDVLTGSNR